VTLDATILGAKQTTTIGVTQTLNVGATSEVNVSAKQTTTIGATSEVNVSSSSKISVGPTLEYSIGESYEGHDGLKFEWKGDHFEEANTKTVQIGVEYKDAELVLSNGDHITCGFIIFSGT
jgi:hypothetical protein